MDTGAYVDKQIPFIRNYDPKTSPSCLALNGFCYYGDERDPPKSTEKVGAILTEVYKRVHEHYLSFQSKPMKSLKKELSSFEKVQQSITSWRKCCAITNQFPEIGKKVTATVIDPQHWESLATDRIYKAIRNANEITYKEPSSSEVWVILPPFPESSTRGESMWDFSGRLLTEGVGRATSHPVISDEEWIKLEETAKKNEDLLDPLTQSMARTNVKLSTNVVYLYFTYLVRGLKKHQYLSEGAPFPNTNSFTVTEILIKLKDKIDAKQTVVIPITFKQGMTSEPHIAIVVIKKGVVSFFDPLGGSRAMGSRKMACGNEFTAVLEGIAALCNEQSDKRHSLVVNEKQVQSDCSSCLIIVCSYLKRALEAEKITQELLEMELPSADIPGLRADLLKTIFTFYSSYERPKHRSHDNPFVDWLHSIKDGVVRFLSPSTTEETIEF